MNKVILVGRIGKDAEVKTFDGGAVKVSFTMATSEKFKAKDGSGVMQEQTEWHNIEMWGERAQKLSQYLLKGKQVMVEGKIHYREYEKDGVKRWATSISCQQLEFMGDKPKDGQQGQPQMAGPATTVVQHHQQQQYPPQGYVQQPQYAPQYTQGQPAQPQYQQQPAYNDPTQQFPPMQQQVANIPPEEYVGNDDLPF